MKKVLFLFLTILFFVFFFEMVSFAGLFFLKHYRNLVYTPITEGSLTPAQRESIMKLINKEEKYITLHPDLGWSIKPNGATDLYRANSQGIRADQNYTLTPIKNKIRIASFGDSFTHGDEVHNNETWQEFLNSKDSRLENINFGVSGYGVDQALLRYLNEGRNFHPKIVLIGFMSEDPTRHGSVFRPFFLPQIDFALTKPRYKLINNELKLIKNPLSTINDYKRFLQHTDRVLAELGQEDFYYQNQIVRSPFDVMTSVRLIKLLGHQYLNPRDNIFTSHSTYDTNSEIYQVTAAIVEKFYNTAWADGAVPVIVIIPSTGDLMRLQKYNIKNYEPFLEIFKRNRWNYIDMTDLFLNDKRNQASFVPLFAPGYHFSALGNQRIAEYLYQYLSETGLLYPEPE